MKKTLHNIVYNVIDGFDSILDNIFPYKRYLEQLKADNFLDFYHSKIHKISFRLIFYTLPFLIVLIYMAILTCSSFFIDLENMIFLKAILSLGLLSSGLIFIYTHKISGCFLILAGLVYGCKTHFLQADLTAGIFFLILAFINLCKLRRFKYYADIASNVLKNKINVELEDEELARLMNTYPVAYDDLQRKYKEEKDQTH